MALSAATIWEVQNGGSDLNGGGYVSGGTDYSQQAAAQLSLTDLACAGGTAVVTSVAGTFTSAMVGNLMRINSGTNFTVGYYQIVTYTSANQVTLDRDPTSGGAGTGGNAKVGGALASPGMALSGMVAGNDLFIKYSATPYTVTSTSANVSNGTMQFNASILGVNANNHMRVCGYDTTRSFGNGDANRPTIKAGGSLGACTMLDVSTGSAAWIDFSDLIIDCTLRDGVHGILGAMQQLTWLRVKVMNTTNAAAFGGTGNRQIFIGCEAKTIDGDGGTYGYAFNVPERSIAYGCIVDTTTGAHGFRVYIESSVIGCIAKDIAGSGKDGFLMDAAAGQAINCVAYNTGRSGFMLNDGAYLQTCINCIAYNAGVSTSSKAYWDTGSETVNTPLINCAWGGSGSAFASTGCLQLGSITLSANPFVNAAAGNFALNGASGGGLLLRQAGFPTSIPFDANMAVGAIQWPDPKAFVHLAAP